jgi:hypothetical protein
MSHSYHQERAPILRIFGDHAGRMAKLLRLNPALLQRIVYAPRSAIHSMGAFLHLAPESCRPDQTVAEILDERDPRELLRCAIPNAPSRLYRALNRAGDTVHERSFYERLSKHCWGPLSDLLLEGGLLNERRLDRVEALLKMDPVIISMRGILDRPMYEIEAIDILLAFLRAHGAFEKADSELPNEAGLPAVLRRLQKALDRIEAPLPDFALPPPFRIVRTIGELRIAGRLLNNCVRHIRALGTDHWMQLASGTTVYVTTIDTPQMLVALRKVGPGLWALDEVRGPDNGSVEGDARTMLIDALRVAGVRLLRDTPSNALSMLSGTGALLNCEDDPVILGEPDVGLAA